MDRERFYLGWALTMYVNKVLNIRSVRGSGQIFRLSNEVVLKLVGKNHKEDTKLLMSVSKLGENNPKFGKLNVVSTYIKIQVIHTDTNCISIYPSLSKAAKQLNTTSKTLKSYIQYNTLFKSVFKIKTAKPKSKVFCLEVTNLETNHIDIYDSNRKAAIGLSTSASSVQRHTNNNIKPFRNKYRTKLL